MGKLNYQHCAIFNFLDNQEPFLSKLKTISQVLEELGMLKINKIELCFSDNNQQVQEITSLVDLLNTVQATQKKNLTYVVGRGTTLMYEPIKGEAPYENVIFFDLDTAKLNSNQLTLWFNTFYFLPVFDQMSAMKLHQTIDEADEPMYNWILDLAKPNRGRIENMLRTIEKIANCKMLVHNQVSYGDYYDPTCWQGYNFYITENHLNDALEWTNAPAGFNKYEWLAPDECKKVFKREKISPKIAALHELSSRRPLLAREQIELDFLQKMLKADSLADLQSIENEINNTATDPELIARLQKYITEKKAFY